MQDILGKRSKKPSPIEPNMPSAHNGISLRLACCRLKKRNHRLTKPQTKRGRPLNEISNYWSAEEERRLMSIVKTHQKNWREIAQLFPNRTPASCSMHWSQLKYLNADALDTRWEVS